MKGKWSPSSIPMPGNMVTSPYPSTRSGQSGLLSLSHYLGHKGRGAYLSPKKSSIQSMFLREKVKEGGMPKKETEYATAAMDQASLPPGHCRPSISLTGLHQQQAKPATPKAGPTYSVESSLHRFPDAPTFRARTGATPSRSLPTGPN